MVIQFKPQKWKPWICVHPTKKLKIGFIGMCPLKAFTTFTWSTSRAASWKWQVKSCKCSKRFISSFTNYQIPESYTWNTCSTVFIFSCEEAALEGQMSLCVLSSWNWPFIFQISTFNFVSWFIWLYLVHLYSNLEPVC